MPRVAIPLFTQDPGAPHPVLGAAPGPCAHAVIGDAGGLTQFGCHLERLPPGSRSSHRHWHETEDEMVYILEGEVVLVEDTETLLRAGEAAAWPAGRAIGHCLENRSETDALYLVVGTRRMADVVHYPDAGVTLSITDRTHRVYTDATGTVLSQGAGAVPQKETQT